MSQHITFIQNHLPALESGNYRIDVSQKVTNKGAQVSEYTAQQQFFVTGKRYSLETGDVNSVFPPAGSSGQFVRALPHIVLNSSSFPWQRSTGYNVPLVNNNRAPWLALFLFDESEPVGQPVQVPISGLRASSAVFFPPQETEYGDDTNAPVNVIDIPISLFNRIAPTINDLQWLAHVRQVSVSKKATNGHKAANDTYSVIIGNRLPKQDRLSTVHLVSLENYSRYLPGTNRTPSHHFPVGYSGIRLVTLYSWTFRAMPEMEGFGALLMNADMNPPTLQLPFTQKQDASQTSNQSVQNAFGMGYTAMNHQLRNGDRTVSWYRGPLLPLASPQFYVKPSSNADPLMRFDPTLGMFDATYASAWQLGRLIALHDNAYAQTLVRWKAALARSVVQQLEEAEIDGQLGLQIDAPNSSSKKEARFSSAVKNIAVPTARGMNARNNENA